MNWCIDINEILVKKKNKKITNKYYGMNMLWSKTFNCHNFHNRIKCHVAISIYRITNWEGNIILQFDKSEYIECAVYANYQFPVNKL